MAKAHGKDGKRKDTEDNKLESNIRKEGRGREVVVEDLNERNITESQSQK